MLYFVLITNTCEMESKPTPLSISIGRNGRYYTYDGENYTKTFPVEWAQNYVCGTGPKDCVLCKERGSWNGVFVGYCHKCAEAYEHSRGYGFWGVHNGESFYPDNPGSATNTYMLNVRLDDIGDKHIADNTSLVRNSSVTLNKIANKNKKRFDKMLRDFDRTLIIHRCVSAIMV